MTTHKIKFRPADSDESDTVASIAWTSRKYFLPYLPGLHPMDDYRQFYRKNVFVACDVWVVEDNQNVVGFCAFKEGWVEHLYLLPSHVGRTLGETLLNTAKEKYDLLQLWVFQRNSRAISFYERNGFTKVKETDGTSNEENLPDALFEWRRPL